MRAYEDPDSEEYNPALVDADRALGRRAAEIARDRHFSGFAELAHTGVGYYEPHLIFRDGDSFLIVETEIRDPSEAEIGAWGRELSNGQVAERGSREYLLAGIQDLGQRTEGAKDVADAIESALSTNRVRYVLVTVVLSGTSGKQKVQSVELTEFTL
jgi:hypothetical protein